jgi:cobalt-zinc-cadmium efflux system outer membrane protein
MYILRKLLLVFLFVSSLSVFSQTRIDTLPITIKEAEDKFISNNYLLLAQKYNVEAAKSLVRQAGLFNNPIVYYEQSIYNRYSKEYFPTRLGNMGDAASQGEFIIQSNWLFSIANKRLKTRQVAQGQADIAKFQFDDLIRTLIFALRGDFYQIYYELQSLKLFDSEIVMLKNIVNNFEEQYQKQNVSLRELTRVRALLFSMENDRLAIYTDFQQNMTEFSILLSDRDTSIWKPVLNEAELDAKYPINKVVLADLLTKAFDNRPDLKAAMAAVATADANVRLQKAVGVPDVMVQEMFDRNGSYIPNYLAGGVQIAIPLFNRNQGNIKSAKAQLESINLGYKQAQANVHNNVFSTFQKIIETEKLNKSISPGFNTDFNTILKGAQINYEKRNLSLIEFVDLFEAYKQTMVNYYSIKSLRYTTFEELNFNTGTDAFK